MTAWWEGGSMVEPVRPIALEDIEAARERIAGVALRTPLVRLDLGPGGPDIRLKLENLQPTNAYKIRGATNARVVIAAIGGGGLITGVGSAIKALRPDIKLFGAEPETAAPYAFSLREGAPSVFPDWEASFVDGAGGQSVTERMWSRMRPLVDGAITVTLAQTRQAL